MLLLFLLEDGEENDVPPPLPPRKIRDNVPPQKPLRHAEEQQIQHELYDKLTRGIVFCYWLLEIVV